MPEIKLKHVVSCSSEDKSYPAENLLLGDGFKKWKSAKSGEKQVSVTFQLEKSVKVEKIDIGNEGSAFIEVLVGKASSEDFQVLLVASSFMTPLDSRAGKNMTSVRMFTTDKLSKNIAEEKWDKVKVVCTQPFNKNIQYGLAFVKFYSPPEAGSTSTPTPAPTQSTLGGFKLKPEGGDQIKTGSLFTNRDKSPPAAPTAKKRVLPQSLTGAAAVRAASKMAEDAQKLSSPSTPAAKPAQRQAQKSVTPSTSRDTPQMKRKHEDDDGGSSKRKSIDSRSESSKKSSESGGESQKTPLRKQSTSVSTVSSTHSSSKSRSSSKPALKKSKSESSRQKDVPFGEMMSSVVFIMSGYQNPERGNIRDKAMEMGAQYKADWGQTCTHLICAFENTPKYNQVKGKGRIVTRKWITDSYKAKQLRSWRNYRLGRARTPPGDSPDGSDSSASDDDIPMRSMESDLSKMSSFISESSTQHGDNSDPSYAGGDTDTDSQSSQSMDDTDDEIQRVKEGGKKTTPKKTTPKKAMAFDESTDEEVDENGTTNGVEGSTDLPPLPDIFKKKEFFFYGTFEPALRRKMKRFVIAYNGTISDYMKDSVTYVLTESNWDDKFDQALTDIPSLSFIRPAWLEACDQQQKYIPYQRYSVVPQ